MDYLGAFEISASGMVAEKTRLETIAQNLANAKTTQTKTGGPYKPHKVITAARTESSFESHLGTRRYNSRSMGVDVVSILPTNSEPRMMYEPGHPDADEKGFVAYPKIDSVSEMVSLIEAVRGYEANVRALNVAKSMALKALEIGR
ncbi:MAG: flagellar basal body rod protein FlgC [Candidatus Sedimenticola sp. (ex Thyasira tokunagai)]